MGRNLLNSFAAEDPERFASLLGTSEDLAGTLSILGTINAGLESNVVARLSPELASRLLSETTDSVITAWLEAGPVDAGRRLLARMDQKRATRLVEGIGDRSRRRALRRLTVFSEGSIGQLAQVQMLSINEDVSAAQVKAELQQYKGPLEGPVIIERHDGTVMGVLDFAGFAQNTSEEAIAADFCTLVKPLYADAPVPLVSTLMRSGDWAKQTSLPVVDHKRRLIGYVTRTTLENASESRKEGGLFLDSLIELVKRYWEFMTYVTVIILGRGVRT